MMGKRGPTLVLNMKDKNVDHGEVTRGDSLLNTVSPLIKLNRCYKSSACCRNIYFLRR